MGNPEQSDLTASEQLLVERVAAEGVGGREQLWVRVREKDGSNDTYFRYLDEGNEVVIHTQVSLLQAALVHGLPVIFHFTHGGEVKEFHAVTLIR